MRNRFTAMVLAALASPLLLWASFGASTARGAGDCSTVDPSLDPEEVGFYLLINQYRIDNGLKPLTISTNLTKAAAWSAQDMGTNRYFSHTDASGRSPSQRAAACGYPYGAGENIAAGLEWSTARAAFEAWRNSPGHNENMLNPPYVQIGIGRYYDPSSPYGWYWVTTFGFTYDGTDGSDIRIAESGVRSAGLVRTQWNMTTVLPGGLRVSELEGWTAWDPLPNGNYQQWGTRDYVPGGSQIGLLPKGMSMDHGRNPR